MWVAGDTDYFLLPGYRRRDGQYEITFLDAEGEPLAIDSSNVLVLKIGKDGQLPLLDICSQEPTANGSTVTNSNPAILRLDQDDLLFAPGIYDLEVSIHDDETGAVRTTIAKGTFSLFETQLGK